MERVLLASGGEDPQIEPHDVTHACWAALRLLRNRLRIQIEPIHYVSIRIGDPAVAVDGHVENVAGSFDVTVVCDSEVSVLRSASETVLRLDDLAHLEVVQRGAVPDAAIALLRLYLPYCLAPLAAQRLGRTVSVCHFAQTLDGRIATTCGDSQWIGCDENLVHAHRMRALCDGVLVGAGTLRRDRPRLNVRRVEGDDPVRIVIGSGPLDLASLVAASSAPVVMIAPIVTAGTKAATTETLVVPPRNGRMHGADIMRALFARGVRSLFVEGGSATTSALLEDGAIDVVQLHIEPLLLGPGVSCFDRAPSRRIADSITFRRHEFFPVGRGMMFVGSR